MTRNKDNTKRLLPDFFASQRQAYLKTIREMLAPFKEIQRRVKGLPCLSIEPQKHLAETIRKPFIESQRRMAAALTEPLRQMQENLAKHLIAPFAKVAEEVQKLPGRMQNALVILGKHGWYIDSEMDLRALWEFEKALSDGDVDEAEQILMKYFRKKMSDIEQDLIKNFPHRGQIFSSAFKAHSRAEYNLSVPVFLAQADGICKELIGIQLFRKRQKVPAIAGYIESLELDAFQAAILYPLCVPLPISDSEYERDEAFVGLNRHQVLHGESLDYGRESNSLKAISLLNYVADVLREEMDDNQEP